MKEEVGTYIGEGIAVGIEESGQMAVDAAEDVADKIADTLTQKRDSLQSKLADYGELFERVKTEDGKELFQLGNLKDDIKQLEKYGDAIEKLNKSGVQLLGCVVNETRSLGTFQFYPERTAVSNAPKKNENTDEKETGGSLPEDLLRPADGQEKAADWKPSGAGSQSVLDELTDDLYQTKGGLSDNEAMWELLRMGKDGSWKQAEEKEAGSNGTIPEQQPVPEPEQHRAAPAPAYEEQPAVQPGLTEEPVDEAGTAIEPESEPEPEPKPAPRSAAVERTGRAAHAAPERRVHKRLGFGRSKPKH